MKMPILIVLFFYIAISIFQISAVADALKLIFMTSNTFFEGLLFIVSLFLTFTPFVGPILGIIGATFIWEWNIFFSALLFFWPYMIGFFFMVLRKNPNQDDASKIKLKDIEDAHILDEEKYK